MRFSAKIAAVEFAGDEVRVALVRTGAKRPVILEAHAARASYASPDQRFDALVAAVKQTAGALKTRPTCYILCASGLNGVARILTVPFRGGKRVAAAVPFELEPYLAVPIEEMTVDFSVIREVEGKTETLAIAMRMAALDEHLAVLKAAGIDPEGINIDAAGLTALWHGRQTGKLGLSAVLHVRDTSAILAVVNEKVLTYFRYLAIPASRFHDNPAAAARDVQNSLRAFLAGWQTGATIQGICVTGIGLDSGQQASFEEVLSVPVRYENLLDGIKGHELLPSPPPIVRSAPAPAPVMAEESPAAGEAALSPEASEPNVALETAPVEIPATIEAVDGPVHSYWEAVIGCAVAAAGGGFDYDFRKGELSRADAMRGATIHAAFSSCLALLALLGYVAYCYIDYRHNVAETERLGQEAWDLFKNAFPESPAVAKRPDNDVGGVLTLELFNKEVEKMSAAPAAPMLEVFQKPTFLDVLAEIASVMPAGGKALINEVKLTVGRSPHIEIRGEEADPAAINEARDKLANSKILTVDSDVMHESKGDKSTFIMKAVPK